ncbi:DUF4376 domain-containing protein [Paraburkholderia youngii]|uniref:DUF4376 domain-containing protein n=1 Tax=Paraburkholderia youngii TaxID=2782701 RepID=UPI003D2285E5
MTNLTTAYQCDTQGVLVGTMLVQEDPHTPGEFLLPPGATLIGPPQFDPSTSLAVFTNGDWTVQFMAPVAPPEPPPADPVLATTDNKPAVQTNEVAVIVGGQWEILADFRGTTYWLPDGSQHVIVDIGETLPSDALRSPPPAPPPEAPTADQARAAQGAILMAAYQMAIQQTVPFTTIAGVAQTFQADPQSQQNLLIATQGYGLAGTVPDRFYWVAADNSRVPFTLNDLKGLYAAMLAQGWTAFQRLQTRKDELKAATTAIEAQAVVW